MTIAFVGLKLPVRLADGKVAAPTLQYHSTGLTAADLLSAAQAADTVWLASPSTDMFGNDVTLLSSIAQNFVTVAPGGRYPYGRVAPTSVEVTDGDSQAGTAFGAAVAPQVAACVTRQTASPGKSHRGRVYIGGLGLGGLLDGGLWDTGLLDSVVTMILAVDAAVVAAQGGVIPVVVSRKLGTESDVINYRPQIPAMTQRRRQARAI